MAYEMVMPYHLHMPSYFLETFTEYPYIDNKLWQEIKEKIDLLFDNYTKRLCHQIPSLTDGDIQICCLIKLRFSNGDIANMLAISPTSVSKRKLRLKERIVQEIGSLGENQSLDLWLMEY